MKRFFFSLIALSAAAIGCTQSALVETPDLFGTEVSFEPYTGRTPVTKAVSADLDYLKKPSNQDGGFYVYGFLNQEGKSPAVYMNNELVYWDATPAKWNYENIVYWPDASSTSTLSFVAYSANAASHFVPNSLSSDGFTFEVPASMDEQVDLLATAFQEDKTLADTQNSGNINLKFHHLLSRVGFKVQTSTDKSVTIKSLSLIGKMPNQGTLTFDKVTGDDVPYLEPNTAADQTYAYVSNGTQAVSGAKLTPVRIPRTGNGGDYMMIMPHTAMEAADALGSDHSINIQYQVHGSQTAKNVDVRLPIGFEFVAGYAYEIILKISTSSITFEVDEKKWDEVDQEVGPIEPDPEPEPETETYNGYIIVSSPNVSITTATFSIELTQDYTEGDSRELGIAYKKTTETNWTYAKASNTIKGTYTIELSNLPADTSYEYCAYTRYGTRSWWTTSWQEPQHYDPINTFTTLATPPTPPTVTLSEIKESDVSNHTVNVSASFTTGTLEGGAPDEIVDYGFCWVKASNGNPSIYDDNCKKSDVSGNSDEFTYTITNLKDGEEYNCAAYVKTQSGNTYYSTVRSFTTILDIPDVDNTGGDWDDEGDGGAL